MARLLEAGLTVLLVSTFAVPVRSNPTSIQPTNNSESAVTQPAQSTVEAKKVEGTRVRDAGQVETTQLTELPAKLSEPERLVLERRLQKVIPPQE